MISVGDKADLNFKVKAVIKGEEKEVNFADLLDKPTIVSVYMKNNTPGCDKQNVSLAQNASYFNEKGYNIIAISKDSCGSHKKYADKHDIDYILVSDPDYLFAKATDSLVEKKMYGKVFEGPSRSAYVFSESGEVLATIKKVNTKDHSTELKELIKTL